MFKLRFPSNVEHSGGLGNLNLSKVGQPIAVPSGSNRAIPLVGAFERTARRLSVPFQYHKLIDVAKQCIRKPSFEVPLKHEFGFKRYTTAGNNHRLRVVVFGPP